MSTQVSERVSKVNLAARRASRLPFGLSPIEAVSALIALLLFAFVVAYYFMYLSPEQEKLRQLEEQDRAQQVLISGTATKPQQPTEAPKADEGKVASESLRTFKEQYLLSRRETESRLRDMINKLNAKHGVQLVGGIPMSVYRAETPGQQENEKRQLEQQALEKFPRLETEFSIAGDYARLRGFLAELESSGLFTLVSSISLLSQEESQEGSKARVAGAIQLTVKLSVPFEDQ